VQQHWNQHVREAGSQNRSKGISILIVTHDSGVAHFAPRIIHFNDGHPIKDEHVKEPRHAERELQNTPAETSPV
jgi:ABC-type lipoprotein export system ATPase subunit